ncbi:MAG TPA: bifunctional adenosylcobinamide kinase/adenosylcobinamide-phosphate guanylyltransferase [Nocardioides sp.]|nr:bifunctional adenosylcobinamide kinase/adenosylcobinamide-phosphate guanylyltransferase [Nocardioides sp.]
MPEPATSTTAARVLVTGGVRSGKSRHAESLLSPLEPVTYVAAGPVRDDADWAERVARHQARRPSLWTTRETVDVEGAVRSALGPVLVDCLGTWLTRVVDEEGLWDAPTGRVEDAVVSRLTGFVDALGSASARVVVVTNEVGLGVVPEHRSGRLFRDLLGTVNQRVAEACDEVHLVVAGRVLVL